MAASKTTKMVIDFNLNSTFELNIFEGKDALPFPLYMSGDFQAGLTIVMLIALVAGDQILLVGKIYFWLVLIAALFLVMVVVHHLLPIVPGYLNAIVRILLAAIDIWYQTFNLGHPRVNFGFS